MLRNWPLVLASMTVLWSAAPANALCTYRGVDNARTTIEQEFNDAALAVRARVHSADYHWALDGQSWTIYSLTVVQHFKGMAPGNLRLFTTRDSGGFYLDREDAPLPSEAEFLLFLNPATLGPDAPPSARGAMIVNYSCGRSGLWSSLTPEDTHALSRLAAR